MKLLVFAPSGAIAAAATTSLPEEIGGGRNWDYRFSWPRDAAFTLQALLSLGCGQEARAFFSWLLHASQLTHPRLQVLYRLDGRAETGREQELALAGYRDSRPVRVGNGAAGTAPARRLRRGARRRGALRPTPPADSTAITAAASPSIADLVCELWHEPDAGIWEVRSEASPLHPVEDDVRRRARPGRRARRGRAAAGGARSSAGEARAARVRDFVEANCYSETQAQLHARSRRRRTRRLAPPGRPGRTTTTPTRRACAAPSTRSAASSRTGPLVRRYVGDDGLAGEDGAFVACSFWLVEALARQGRVDEAAAADGRARRLSPMTSASTPRRSTPTSGEFLGNFPQGLSHLALINAAVALAEVSR